MLKRKLVIVSTVIVLMLIMIITSCNPSTPEVSDNSSQESSQEEVFYDFKGKTIRISQPFAVPREKGVSEAQDRFADRLSEVESKFNVVLEYYDMSGEDYFNTVVTQILAGEVPGDFMNVRSQEFMSWYTAGVMKDLTANDSIDFTEAGRFNEAALEAFTVGGKVMALPDDPQIMGVVLFNKRILEEAGVEEDPYELVASDNWTWEKMAEIAKKVTKDNTGDGNIDCWGIGGYDEAAVATNMIVNNDASVVKIDNGKPIYQLNTPNALEALNVFYSWFNVDRIGYVFPDGAAWDHILTAFKDGKVAMVYGHDWFREYLTEMEDDFGIVVPPRGPKGTGYRSDAWKFTGLMVPNNTTHDLSALLDVWDEINQPLYPEEDEWERMRISYEATGTLRDKESIETFITIRKDNLQIFNGMELYNLMYLAPAETQVYPSIFREISRGKAVAEAVQEKEEAINTYLEENFGG